MPGDWLAATYPDEQARQHYRCKHDLGELPPDIQGFEAFYTARGDRLRERLTELLAPASSGQEMASAELPNGAAREIGLL